MLEQNLVCGKVKAPEKFLKRAKHVHLVDSWSPIVYEEPMNMETMKHIWIDIPLVKLQEIADFVKYYNLIYENVKVRFHSSNYT